MHDFFSFNCHGKGKLWEKDLFEKSHFLQVSNAIFQITNEVNHKMADL